MAKPISWAIRAHEIRDRVRRATADVWSRQDLEELFEVKRVTAQSLMRSIGEVQYIGGTHFVGRDVLLGFLDEMVKADNIASALQTRLLQAEPPPRPRKLANPLPQEHKSIMLKDLPASIELSPGRLVITGSDSFEIIRGLHLLAQALQNDLESVQQSLDPPPTPPAVEDGDLRRLFEQLRADEGRFYAKRQNG